ncbi:hypothetical protein GCM10027402_10180 [Arthrobacter monumenti]
MPGHTHTAGIANPVRTVMVQEAPGANQAALALGERAAHIHGPRATEWNIPRNQNFQAIRIVLRLAQYFPRGYFNVAHAGALPSVGSLP